MIIIRKIPTKFSPSSINTWQTCPRSWYYHYIDHREQIKTPDSATFGITVHNICDHYYDMIKADTTIEEVPKIIEEAFTELGNYSTQKRKAAARTCQESLLRFERKRIKQNLGLPTVREKMLSAKIADHLPVIRGKTDMYFESAGLIIDWKTGKWGELSDTLRIQGKIYKMILEANGYHPKQVIFDFLVLGKRIILPEVSTSWIIGKIEDMMDQINNNKFPKTPNNLCNKWCGYKLDCDLHNMCPLVIP